MLVLTANNNSYKQQERHRSSALRSNTHNCQKVRQQAGFQFVLEEALAPEVVICIHPIRVPRIQSSARDDSGQLSVIGIALLHQLPRDDEQAAGNEICKIDRLDEVPIRRD